MCPATETSAAPPAAPRPRRALVFAADDETAAALCARLVRAGYEAQAASNERAARAVSEHAPDVALVELRADAHGASDDLALAAELRAAPLSHALPLVLLFHTDDEAQRRAAQALGADDYFALAAPDAELSARLDALLWRGEAGRRAHALNAAAVGAEIDDFMRLFEAVRAGVQTGAHGALALVAAVPVRDIAQVEQTLAAAHEFFKLNLRRLDAIAFYGPTMLVIYLPRRGPGAASSTLAQLRDEFVAAHPSRRLLFGLAAFPADGRDVEALIERAESALAVARASLAAHAADAHDVESAPTPAATRGGTHEAPRQPAAVPNVAALAPDEAREGLERRRALRESKSADTF